MTRLQALSAAVVLTTLWACQVPGSEPGSGGSSAASRRGSEPSTLRVETPPLEWSEPTPATGGRRLALLIAADQYADPRWNLGFTRPSCDRLEAVLEDRLGFAPDDVLIKAGDRVTPDSIRGQLERWSREVQGPDNVLLVHWVGHGFNIDGQQRFLTYASRHDGSWTDTVAYHELTGWMSDAQREVASRGGELRTALVVDACRTRTMDVSAPGTISRHEPQVDVEAFAAAPGQIAVAKAGEEITAFTGAFAEALSAGVRSDVRLRDALERATAATREQGGRITTGEADVVLLDRQNLSVSVRAVDARTGAFLPGARIQLNGQEQEGEALFGGLAESPEGYDLRVMAPGFFWRAETLPLDQARSRSLVTVPLAPEYVALVGRVEFEGTGAVRVSVTGGFAGLSEDDHETSVTRSGSGPFALRVPRATGARSLVIEVNGDEVRRRDFDLATLPARTQEVDGASVSVFEFGTQVVELRSTTQAVGAGIDAQIVGGVDLAFAWSLGREDFLDDNGWVTYQQVRQLAEGRLFEQAARSLEGIVTQGRSRASADSELATVQTELEVASALQQASDLQAAGDLRGALEVLDGSEHRAHSKLRPVLLSWLQAAAREEVALQDYASAEQALHVAADLSPDPSSIQSQLQRLHETWLQASFDSALETGDWASVERLLTRVCAESRGIEAGVWKTRIEEESISPGCRRHYDLAQEALAQGDLEEAYDAFTTALSSGVNEHYRSSIEEQCAPLRSSLYAKYSLIGAERLQAQDKPGALRAYARAMVFDALAQSMVLSLLDDHELVEDDPVLVAEAEGLVEAERERQAAEHAARLENPSLDDLVDGDRRRRLGGMTRRIGSIRLDWVRMMRDQTATFPDGNNTAPELYFSVQICTTYGGVTRCQEIGRVGPGNTALHTGDYSGGSGGKYAHNGLRAIDLPAITVSSEQIRQADDRSRDELRKILIRRWSAEGKNAESIQQLDAELTATLPSVAVAFLYRRDTRWSHAWEVAGGFHGSLREIFDHIDQGPKSWRSNEGNSRSVNAIKVDEDEYAIYPASEHPDHWCSGKAWGEVSLEVSSASSP